MVLNNELVRACKKAVVVYFMVLPRHLPGGAEETHDEPQLR
jgi:hypothetical protein